MIAENIIQGATAITTVITVTMVIGRIRDNTSPMLAIMRRITFTSFREVLLRSRLRATSALDKSERKLDSIIQLIVRNVKQIFMRGYILQIAVLIAASGAFGDQIK